MNKKVLISLIVLLLVGSLLIGFALYFNLKDNNQDSNKNNEEKIYNNSSDIEKFNKIVKYAFENTNNDKSYSDEYPSFYVDSVHANSPGAFGSTIGDTYYFNSDGTYLWSLSKAEVLERKVASAGKFEIKDNKLVLTELYTLTKEDGKTDEIPIPGGGLALGFIDYKYQVNDSNKIYSYTIKNEGLSSYKSETNPEDTREDSYSLTDSETKYWYSIGDKYDYIFANWLNEYYEMIK